MWAALSCGRDYKHFFKENTFTFTGKLSLMGRDEAFDIVKLLGGKCSRNLTKRTKVLVVGSYHKGECLRNKYHAALKYNEQGQDIRIIDENTFYQMLLNYFALTGKDEALARVLLE